MSAPGPIRCLGIVNRGEAAMRCLRTVKALRAREGSDRRAVVLYTDVDRDAPFVRHADVAVRLAAPHGEVAAYLDHERVLAALGGAGADAVWPGWGFVAEDPVFADRVAAAGMRFLGPSGEAMRALGDKISAKLVAERAGVPVTPWSGGMLDDVRSAAVMAERIGYPVVVKAAAGGGGRGIRVVEDSAALLAAFRSAASEAQAAFGDGRLFLERKVSGARHIEVQIAADRYGHVLALGARDCSVQRRHQKLVEEAPPPGLAPDVVGRLAAASANLACDVGYAGLGTVEFLVDGDEAHFLEMNPRLQVEHGITEAVTGLDLVELQIRIAEGARLDGLAWVARGVAIEARVCAEDPDAGFVPSPGRIARFDPALGPGIRVDTGIAAGSVVPPAFDSLVAKVIGVGATREEARSRLVCALRDLDLVIEGGASNTGYLIDVLESPEFRRGGVDTGWVDRRGATGVAAGALASDALVAAAILGYQRRRRDARVNFFADTANPSPARVPASAGREVDLSFGGAAYRPTVFALGSWRYRVQLDGHAVVATLRERDGHLARLELPERTRRLVYDASELGLRLEVDGRPHRFSWATTGHVRAAAPAMVVGVQAAVGDHVVAGQVLGLLEAMKVEIGFAAPIAGVVTEIRAAKGQLVAAGDVLVVIEPAADAVADGRGGSRLVLAPAPDPTASILSGGPDGAAQPPNLAVLDACAPDVRQAAVAALRDEVCVVLLGYDADPERTGRLVAALEGIDPEVLSAELRADLGALAHEIAVFADIEGLFVTAPGAADGGRVEPSPAARLRAYVRRMHAGGAGVPEEFLARLRAALRHYGVASLDHDDALERALVRLFATQNAPALRRLLVRAALRSLAALAPVAADDAPLADVLRRIAAMRALVGDAVADAAIEAHAAIVDGLPDDNRPDRSGRHGDAADVVARLLRAYAPDGAVTATGRGAEGAARLCLPDGRVVLGATTQAANAAATVRGLLGAATSDPDGVHALEVVVTDGPGADADMVVAAACDALLAAVEGPPRCTLSCAGADGEDVHRTLVRDATGVREDGTFLGLHPEVAARIGLARLRTFELERLPAGDDLYCFAGRSRTVPDDERLFVLGEVRGRTSSESGATAAHVAAFERLFHRATSTLRALRSIRDPRRRLHWNRISIAVAPAIGLDEPAMRAIADRLAPATQHLGLEKVIVRVRLLDRGSGDAGPPIELVASDLTGGHLELEPRAPDVDPVATATAYDRRVVEARRRRLFHPYEVIRRLTGGDGTSDRFTEWDLDPTSRAPRAVPQPRRERGANVAGIVFGILSTPTDEVPEGLKRVLILSDPTRDLGALAAPECDRIVAALGLARRLGLPVEWIPISSGARIAMDSGTENLDATARVVRRIVRFTQKGGVIHLIVSGVNVGAQSYWNALATMLGRTRGALVMTAAASMVLTGRAALEASGSVAAEDEVALGGFERIMGPNGEAQYYASDLASAFATLESHYRYTYVVPGEKAPRRHRTADPDDRDVTAAPYPSEHGGGFTTIGDIFDDATNPGRKRPFAMRALMAATVDQDGGHLERWRAWAGAETAIVWDACLGGMPICLLGIESQNVTRDGYRPLDGPAAWNAGTLFPQSSKKVARALDAASGNRPVVILANLSGFDGSPESLRKLQLEHGAEIARAVVGFESPLLFVVVSRYHGGAYVVFSRELNPRLQAFALTGSYASVIGGAAASAVVFTRDVRARAAASAAVRDAAEVLRTRLSVSARDAYDTVLADALRTAQADVAAEFDRIHTVERACRVGSLDAIVEPCALRPTLIAALRAALVSADDRRAFDTAPGAGWREPDPTSP